MRAWWVWASLVLGGAGCGGCHEGITDGVAPPLPIVSGLEPRLVVGAPGEPVAIHLTMTDSDGAPVEPFELTWLDAPSGSAGAGIDVTLAEDYGTRDATLVPHVLDRYTIGARIRVCTGDADGDPQRWCNSADYGPVTLLVAGGSATELDPLVDAVSLVVGETRAVDALAIAPVPAMPDRTTASRDPVTVTIANPAIASASGTRVTALATGTTTLTLHAGAQAATIPLTVTSGTLTPPADGIYTAGPASAISSGFGGVNIRDKTDHQLALDSRGYPVALVTPDRPDRDRSRVWLAEWTGSGFGHQPIGFYYDWAAIPQLAIDERDHRYVVFTSILLPGLWIAERAADGGPGDWRFRKLPRFPNADELEHTAPFDSNETNVSSDATFSLLPRAGGGVWVAYVVWGNDDPFTCTRTLRLLEVTDTTVDVQDVQLFGFDKPSANADCNALGVSLSYGISDLVLVPPAMGQTRPRIVVHNDLVNVPWATADMLSLLGANWTQTPYLPPSTYPDEAKYLPIKLAVAKPLSSTAIAYWLGDSLPFSELRPHMLAGSQMPWTPWQSMYAHAGSSDPYAFAINDSLYLGDGYVGPLMRATPYGAMYYDDPLPVLLPAYDTDQYQYLWKNISMRGETSDGTHAHWLVDYVAIPQAGVGLKYMRVTPPKHVLHTDPESTGWRISSGLITPVATVPPLVLASGARLLVTTRRDTNQMYRQDDGIAVRTAAPQLLSSSGPGMPWTDLGTDGRLSPYLFEVGGALYGVRHTLTNDGFELVKSIDGGASWTVNGTSAANGSIRRVARAGNALFVLTWAEVGVSNMELHYLADITAGGTFTDVMSAQTAVVMSPPIARTMDQQIGLIPSTTGVTLYHGGLVDPVRRGYAASNGAATFASVVTNDDAEMIASTGVRRSDGSIVVLARRPQSEGIRYDLVRTTDDFATTIVVSTIASSGWSDGAQLVQLANGDLIAAAGVRQRDEIYKAAFVTSTSGGTTWGSPVKIRSQGGNGQSVATVAEDADGGLLFVIGETNSMRAWTRMDITNDGANNLDDPLDPDHVVVRIAP